MRNLLLAALMVATSTTAATVEATNGQDCYTLTTTATSDCLQAIRAGRPFQVETKGNPSASQEASSRESQKASLEQRSVEAQEASVRAQESIANALWTGIAITVISAIALVISIH